MSSSSSALVEALSQYLSYQHIGAGLTALVAYEYIITFDLEVDSVWNRRFHGYICATYISTLDNAAWSNNSMAGVTNNVG
ncbi:hypothetical protein PHLGIDRAFT_200678 [Phlebiopsis gigantea 11061_1 CR5-6]|uniref:DUF6533 domain-containing protein n=1 Tax=Phlebiopsis gigantea (strain 11061_1 CR5-6) TaxID=745531 RepID=A0A0C3S6W4_PHLG1|nr:hypothetical protein PHLGIDRAFT_200678 [Phlebiopsis gigantea 11061_1 CR5-6]